MAVGDFIDVTEDPASDIAAEFAQSRIPATLPQSMPLPSDSGVTAPRPWFLYALLALAVYILMSEE